MYYMIIPILVISIPIIALIADAIVKIKKMKLEGSLSEEEKKQLKAVIEENKELRKRIEVLELLVADNENPKLSIVKDNDYQKQIDYLAEEILKLKVATKHKDLE